MMGVKVSNEVVHLKEIFGDRVIKCIDGSYILKSSIRCFYIYAVLDGRLIMKEVHSMYDLRFKSSDFCIMPIKSVLTDYYKGIEYAKKLESKFMSKFGYSFDFIRYNRFCEIILGESHYFLPADSMLTIEDFIRYLPDLAFKKGLRIKYIDLYCIDADLENGEANFCILNTKNNKYISEKFTFSELNNMNLIDLVVRYKELYPVSGSNRVKVLDVNKKGIVKYQITYYGKTRIESVPLELFLDSPSGMLIGIKSPNNSLVAESVRNVFTKDIESAIREYRDNVICNWGY